MPSISAEAARRRTRRHISAIRPMQRSQAHLSERKSDAGTTFLGCKVPPAFMARFQCAVAVSGLLMREAITASLQNFIVKAEKQIDERGYTKGYDILLNQKAILLDVSVDEVKDTCDVMYRKLQKRIASARLKKKEYDELLRSLSK